MKENKQKGYRRQQQYYEPGELYPKAAAEVTTDYPIVQDAKGAAGTSKKRGITTGFGPGGSGSY